MKNLILVDYDGPDDWEFKEAVEKASKEPWEVFKAVTNGYHGGKLKELIRYIMYFLVPIKVLFRRSSYKNVLAWQQFFGIILAFYFRLFHVKNAPQITIMTFIFKPKKSIFGIVYKRFIEFSVKSNYINKIIVFSENEKKYYAELFSMNSEIFIAETLGIEDSYMAMKPYIKDEGYFVSAGRSNRDYSFLCNNWMDDFGTLKIITDSDVNHNASKAIEVIRDCYDSDFLKILSGCRGVIIPLQDVNISSGQLVVLQSMMLGKPVIATENASVTSYLSNKKTGFIIGKNKYELEEAIEQIKQDSIYFELSENSREEFKKLFSLYAMGVRIGGMFCE